MNTVLLLIASNLFMTLAWYGHLKHRHHSMVAVVLVSWLIALPEYALQVPANRLGYGTFTAYQLKILQEVITLVVFIGFAWVYLNEPPRWNTLAAMGCILAAVVLAFRF